LPHQALALGFARRLGWKVLVQGPGAPIDQRLRAALARSITFLEGQGHERATIASALAAFGLGAGMRPKLPPAPKGAGLADILPFCLAALMNEGAKILSEGGARRPSDIDAAALLSGLFPRWEGGPMYQADRMGLMALRANLRTRAETAPRLFAPAPVLDTLISEGKTFADLNRG
jgi:3-hydroxyacyl-CoA dehydrogenase